MFNFIGALNNKTIKVYIIDLRHFSKHINNTFLKETICRYIDMLHKTIPLNVIKNILSHAYDFLFHFETDYQKCYAACDIIVLEILFLQPEPKYEVCNLTPTSVDLINYFNAK